MANYYASFRSNYFKVRDVAAFKAWIGRFASLEVFEDEDNKGLYGFGSMDEGIPSGVTGPAPEYDWIEVDFINELYPHLAEGEVAIIQECGSEKLRYLIGFSGVVDWLGNYKEFNIDAAYRWANKKYGKEISRCEY